MLHLRDRAIWGVGRSHIADGAGAAPLAALVKERDRMHGKRVVLILSGGNIDGDVLRIVLSGQTPGA